MQLHPKILERMPWLDPEDEDFEVESLALEIADLYREMASAAPHRQHTQRLLDSAVDAFEADPFNEGVVHHLTALMQVHCNLLDQAVDLLDTLNTLRARRIPQNGREDSEI